MADPKGFMTYPRVAPGYRPKDERVKDYAEVAVPLTPDVLHEQAARCMDCGVPFCHGLGCPLGNRIPEFNELVYRGLWKKACDLLHSTNNFPEITGRICPALCEASCTLNINQNPVTIREIENQIVERGFAEGWVRPIRPKTRTGKRVAIVGSGPAGLAAAQQLTRVGHTVYVFEKSSRIGGLLRYGIPDFKLDKSVLDRRIEQMRAEGVHFETDVTVGHDISPRYLRRSFDAICLTMGAGKPRGLTVPGSTLDGVHFAMDFLTQQNKRVAGDSEWDVRNPPITAAGKHVVVVGGGDTGSDCVGTSIRQGALSVTQYEILPQPPEGLNPETPWPEWPKIMRTSSSHQEGCTRRWSILTEELRGAGGHVTELVGCEVDWQKQDDGNWKMVKRPDSSFTVKAGLVLLAMGFLHVEHGDLVSPMALEKDERGNVLTNSFMTSEEGVFAAGDTIRGASLVVHAIKSGREAATAIDAWLRK